MSANQLEANQKRPLNDIFISTFHDKMSFNEFLTLNVSDEFKRIQLNKREVYAPSSKLKAIHRFINKTIFEYADYNRDVVYSYRKGVSTRDAIEKHSASNYFFQTDISNFYNNVRLENIYKSLRCQLNNTPVLDIENYIDNIVNLVVVDDRLPTGFGTSPLLSNICLFDFDNALLKYCKDNFLIYTRYSDDIIVSGSDDGFEVEIENVVSNYLNHFVNEKIKINSAKTKFHKKGHSFKLLGFSILPNGIVTIPSSDKKEVESLIYFYLTNNEKFEDLFKKISSNNKIENSEGKPIRELAISSLSGKLISFNAMDKGYISKLRKKYGNTIIDMFIRKAVK